jgi:HJR/Mrr/RecB family endonuclease
MCRGHLDFLRQIVNPILNKYWSLSPEFQEFAQELRKLIFSDEKRHEYFKDYEVLERYLKCELRDYWRFFKEKYEEHAEVIDEVFVEMLKEVAHYFEFLKRTVEEIIKDEIEEMELLITVEDEDSHPLPGAKIELWFQDKLLNKFIVNEEGIGHIKLGFKEKKHFSSLKAVVYHDGYEKIAVPLALLSNRIMLKRREGRIIIKVIGDQLKPEKIVEKGPIADCSIIVIRHFSTAKGSIRVSKWKEEARTLTDDNGIAEFRLPFGEYKILLEAENFEPEILFINLNEDLIVQEVELKRERFEHLYVIVSKKVGELFYEPIKGCKILEVKSLIENDVAEEFEVPFVQLRESDDKGQIVIKSESGFDFNVHWRYKVRISVPVNGRYIEVYGEGKPPVIEILLTKPKVPREVPSKPDELTSIDFSEIDSHEFVRIVKKLLEMSGYENIEITDGPHDGGADLVCTKGGKRVIVQCKRWKNPVGLSTLRDFIGAMVSKRVQAGVFITTSSLTKDARDFVRKVQTCGLVIDVFDNIRLKQLLRNLKITAEKSLAMDEEEKKKEELMRELEEIRRQIEKLKRGEIERG